MPGARDRDDDLVNQIKSRISLLDLVQAHVRLRKQGREYTGLCPFHQEKTPSFWVNEQMQSWYCFGCQRGGDVLSFQQLIEKTDFKGALDSLAELAGVERKQESGAQKERTALRRRIVEMNRLAQQYYEYVLWSTPAGEPGRRLLARRDVNEELARQFGLGYAPGGANFASFLKKRSHKLGDAAAAGLVRGDNQDFFAERVLIPIRDERGAPLAFTGRTVSSDDPRKYVNTRETPAYVKGRVLFALDVARQAISDRGHAVLMEGQFDVIVAHRFGVNNAVASSGTALTAEQVRLLARFTEEVVLVFDNDNAGKAAAFKAIEQAAEGKLRTRVGVLDGPAKDPDESLRAAGDQAPARWEQVLKAAQPGWEFWIRDSVRDLNPNLRPADLEVALRRVGEVLLKIEDPAVRETYRQQSAYWLGVDANRVVIRPPAPPRDGARRATGAGSDVSNSGATGKEWSVPFRYLLEILAVRPDAILRVRDRLPETDLEPKELSAYRRFLETVGTEGGLQALGDALPGFPDEEQDLVRRAWAHPPASTDDATVDDVVSRIRREITRRRARAIISDLRDAEVRGDAEQIALLNTRLADLRREEGS
ncbi:MAG: DNA primase [Chloroflexota bacterium]